MSFMNCCLLFDDCLCMFGEYVWILGQFPYFYLGVRYVK